MGLCAFLLFFMSDYNDWRWGYRGLRGCFPLGILLLAAGTILSIREGEPLLSGWARGVTVILAALFFVLLVHALFFALPANASYARPGERRPVCVKGVYALCRHPGVLWFMGLYTCLWLSCGLPIWQAVLYSGLDVLLVAFEDRCVFPEKLEGYGDYQVSTPFLLPNRRSIRTCWKAS